MRTPTLHNSPPLRLLLATSVLYALAFLAIWVFPGLPHWVKTLFCVAPLFNLGFVLPARRERSTSHRSS